MVGPKLKDQADEEPAAEAEEEQAPVEEPAEEVVVEEVAAKANEEPEPKLAAKQANLPRGVIELNREEIQKRQFICEKALPSPKKRSVVL
jgi:uncharacterized membrane protein